MTRVFLTVDTELSLGSHQRGVSPDTNLAQSIFGETPAGSFGIGWQMERLDHHGLTGVFFVDPVPAALFGMDMLKRIVAPILTAGHEVQLHIHTEWLKFLTGSPVDGRLGENIGDFSEEDQVALVGWARDLLTAAGAPDPAAFRAGNFGADDRTLRALAQLGITWDSSFNAAYLGAPCRVDLPPLGLDPVGTKGVRELPVTQIFDRPGRLRPAQLCALSHREMLAMLDHAEAQHQSAVNIVSHSFELISRDRRRPNQSVINRFEALCAVLAERRDSLPTSGFANLSFPDASHAATPLPASTLRTWERMAEQAIGHWRYERG